MPTTQALGYWQWRREQNLTVSRCVKHEISNCATCAGHDDLEEALVGKPVTPRTLPPGVSIGEVQFRGTWDTHSPFHKCANPACCDPIDTLRQQSGVVPVEQPEPTPDGKCRDTTHTVRNVYGTLICVTCMTEAL